MRIAVLVITGVIVAPSVATAASINAERTAILAAVAAELSQAEQEIDQLQARLTQTEKVLAEMTVKCGDLCKPSEAPK